MPKLKYSFNARRDFIVIFPDLINNGNRNATNVEFSCRISGPFRFVQPSIVYNNYPRPEEREYGTVSISDSDDSNVFYWKSLTNDPLRPKHKSLKVGYLAFNRMPSGDDDLSLEFTFFADELPDEGQTESIVLPINLFPTIDELKSPKYRIVNSKGSESTADTKYPYRIDSGMEMITSDED